MVWKMYSSDKVNKEVKKDEKSKKSDNINKKVGKNSDETKLVKQSKPIKTPKPKKEEKLYVIPLGGLDEVGKNMTLLQYRDEIIIIDSGLTFPDEELLGIDLVIPDYTYLEKNQEKIKGIVITHGHEDHIGGLPYLFQKIRKDVPIYGSKLALALAKSKFEKKNKSNEYIFKEVKGRDKVKIGKYFESEFISITHSIADAFSIAFHTPVGTIVHSGDFKIDLTPVDGNGVDFYKLAELGEKGVLLFLSDSTNANVEGFTASERSVGESLKEEFAKIKGRIIIAAFASHIHRLQQIVDIAHQTKRKIAIDGRSMIKVFDIATTLGYLKVPNGVLVSLKEVESLSESEVVILCTGTQGEPMAALSRIAKKTHKHIKIKKGDTVIISATPIPGNEKAVHNNINNLLKNQAEVIFEKIAGIHVSGHGSQDEQRLMLNLIKPKYFMPVHGEFSMLKKHKELAMETGIPSENVIIATNGSKIEVKKNGVKISGKVPSGSTLVDGLGVGDVGNIVLRDRQYLAQDGIVIVVLTISSETGCIMAGPDIITRGFVYARESEDLIAETTFRIREQLKKYEKECVKEWAVLKNAVRESANSYLYEKTNRNPIILPIIMEV